MLWRVDLSSEVPIYEQLASSLRREMAAGRLVKGDRLPSARDVAGSLAINLHTVLRAYQELREVGLIELRRGRGRGTSPRPGSPSPDPWRQCWSGRPPCWRSGTRCRNASGCGGSNSSRTSPSISLRSSSSRPPSRSVVVQPFSRWAWALHRSIRHGYAVHPLGTVVALGGSVYGLALGQAAVQGSASASWPFAALACGFAVGDLLTRWVRERVPQARGRIEHTERALDVPEPARLAWNGWVRPGLAMRVGFLPLWSVAIAAFSWWSGFPSWVRAGPFLGALLGHLVASRRRQFAIDYSGGDRGGSPVPARHSSSTATPSPTSWSPSTALAKRRLS